MVVNYITVMDWSVGEIRVFNVAGQGISENEEAEAWLQEHDEAWDDRTCEYIMSPSEVRVRVM